MKRVVSKAGWKADWKAEQMVGKLVYQKAVVMAD